MKKHRYNEKSILFSNPMSIEAYQQYKIKILKRDFEIELTDEEIVHICSLDSMSQIDKYCREILLKNWNKQDEEEEPHES